MYKFLYCIATITSQMQHIYDGLDIFIHLVFAKSMTPLQKYENLIHSKVIEKDPAQVQMVQALEALFTQLTAKKSLMSFLSKNNSPKGLYIHGLVGRGKTFLMDLFYGCLPHKNKMRVHFHEFMNEVHEDIFEIRAKIKAGEIKGEPLDFIANKISTKTQIICFDEFSVIDITDAMILGRLFEKLWARKIVILATSNVAPQNLYQNGLNRALFVPFIAMIEHKMTVLELKSRTDYRLEKLNAMPVWYSPHNAETTQKLHQAFQDLTHHQAPIPMILSHKGREFTLSRTAFGVAYASFSQLCEAPLAAADYLLLAHHFHTLVLENIPKLSRKHSSPAKRFINLIDALYDNRVKLIASCAVEVSDIYAEKDGIEGFEFARTQSRLIEMRTREYLESPHGRADKVKS